MAKTIKQWLGSVLIPRLPLTRENFDRLRFEANAARVNLKNKLSPFAISKIKKIARQDSLSVNVASGPFGEKDWINIDMFRHSNIAFTFDCRKKLPFRNSSVVRIRAEHVVEHFDVKEEAPRFLQECRRVLKPEGVLRIVVPDIEKFVKAYLANENQEWKNIGWDIDNLPADMPTPVYVLNHVFRQDGEHKFGYDFEALKQIVMENGFSKVIRQEWGKSVDEKLCADLENHRPYSLYVDCVK